MIITLQYSGVVSLFLSQHVELNLTLTLFLEKTTDNANVPFNSSQREEKNK